MSAHITFCRYTSSLADPPAFLGFIDKNAGYEFGEEPVDRFELVEHDWYNMENKKRVKNHLQSRWLFKAKSKAFKRHSNYRYSP